MCETNFPFIAYLLSLLLNSLLFQALKELEIDDSSFVVQNLENSLIWNTRACPIKDLVMMLSFCINRRNTEGQNKLFNEVCKSMERRWVEIKGNIKFN